MRTILALALFVGAMTLAACGGSTPKEPAKDVPATLSVNGDPGSGELVFATRGCGACHTTNTEKITGPGMAGVLEEDGVVHDSNVDYGGKLPNGQPRSEENVGAWIRSGGQGKIGVMPPQTLEDQDLADLLAYLRTLKKATAAGAQ